MARKFKKADIMILDVLRKSPGTTTEKLASLAQLDPEQVWDTVTDPQFKELLCTSKGAHVAQLELLHKIAMEKVTDCLYSEDDPKKALDLAKWLLKYSTDSIVRVSEVNAQVGNTDNGVTINQMLGMDPFAKKKDK